MPLAIAYVTAATAGPNVVPQTIPIFAASAASRNPFAAISLAAKVIFAFSVVNALIQKNNVCTLPSTCMSVADCATQSATN